MHAAPVVVGRHVLAEHLGEFGIRRRIDRLIELANDLLGVL